MKILVIGGCGFIGSHIVDRLVSAGMTVAVLDHRQEVYRLPVPGVTYHCGSWFENGLLDRMLLNGGFSCVVHLGWTTTPYTSNLDPRRDAHENVVGSLSVLDACVRGKVTSVIFASSGGTVYGPSDLLPLSEEQPTEPISAYGIAKLASERYLYFYSKQYGIPYVALRYANVYGPRQNPHGEAGVVAIFIEKLLRGQQPVINGDGKQTRDYVFVGDIVRANVAALTADFCGALNLGTGIETDVNAIFRTLVEVGPFPAEEKHGPGMPGEQLRSVIDASRAREVLGWQPEVDFAEGLRRTIAFFRSV